MQNRGFNNKILICMGSLGIGDILALTPVLEGLRRDHPTAMIELDTTFPELFVNNPYVNKVHSIDRHHTEAYDRMIAISLPTIRVTI